MLDIAIKNKMIGNTASFIHFVRVSSSINGPVGKAYVNDETSSILEMTDGWILLGYKKDNRVFPRIPPLPTTDRPAIFSKEKEICILTELTVSWKEGMEEVSERNIIQCGGHGVSPLD